MTDYPRTFSTEAAPPEILDLVRRLMPLLLVGEHPALDALRAQYARAHIAAVELTGVGFYADFSVPGDTPRAQPAAFAGGNVLIELEGVENGGGCVLFVREGCLAFLEGYTYGNEPWPEHVLVRGLVLGQPIQPPEPVVTPKPSA